MKNLKIKRLLSLVILSAVMISTTPVFAATNSSSGKKLITTVSDSAEKKAASTIKIASAEYDDRTVNDVLADGELVDYGDYGLAVKMVQQCLNGCGHSVTIDGHFGSATRSAVKSFQSDQHLTVDGKVGKKTWTYLKARQD